MDTDIVILSVFFLGQKKLSVNFSNWIMILDWNLKVDLSIHLSSDQLRMLSFSRILLYRHRKSDTHHISAHCHLALYSMFHVGYFLMKWWLEAKPNQWAQKMNGWKGSCMNIYTCCCIAGCDKGHTGIERRSLGEHVVMVQWVDQILQRITTKGHKDLLLSPDTTRGEIKGLSILGD